MNWEKYFSLEKMERTHWEFCPYHKTFRQKAFKMFTSSLVNEL